MPDVPESLIAEFEQQFPGGFTLRDEANAIVAYAFRTASSYLSRIKRYRLRNEEEITVD